MDDYPYLYPSYLPWGAYLNSINTIVIDSGVTTIGQSAFYACSNLTLITIPNSVITIGRAAFEKCKKLTSVTIPNSVIIIGQAAFVDCGLTSITIPNSVIQIVPLVFICGTPVFYYTNLKFIICEAIIPPIIHQYAFDGTPDTIPIYVPCNSLNAYQTATYWNRFTNFIAIPDTSVTHYSASICEGNVYSDIHFTNLTQAGNYYDTLQSINSCDSIICLNLSYYPTPISYDTAIICEGDSYIFDEKELTKEGIYYDTLRSINFCDSIICLNLSYYQIPVLYDTVSICQGDTYSFGGEELTKDSVYYCTLQNVNDCDSIIELTLTVHHVPPVSQIFDSIRQGDTCYFHGKPLTKEGTYYDTLQTVFGCDSIIRLTLTVHHVLTLPENHHSKQGFTRAM